MNIWSTQELLNLFVALAVIIDPLIAASIFAGLTTEMTRSERARVAVRAHVVATATLVVFALGGGEILRLLGISFPAFRVAGGLLLLLISIEMVSGKRAERKERTATQATEHQQGESDGHMASDIAVVPIGIPLLAGPGAIAAVLLLSAGPHGESIAGLGLLVGAVLVVLAASLALFLAAGQLSGMVTPVIVLVLTRLLGILMAALATQFILDGLMEASLF